MGNYIKYLGHSAFYIKYETCGILTDPWISYNDKIDFDISKELITHIFVTHGHSDHFGDTIEIAKATNAEVTAIFETANYCQSQGINANGVGLGAAIPFEFGSARFLPATHTNSLPNGEYGGIAASVLFDFNGIKVFHAGDSGLTNEYSLTGELYKPDYAMLPIGGHFTMGVDEAVIAAKLLNASNVIPMHYNTFNAIKADAEDFKAKLEKIGKTCHVLPLNGVLTL